MEIRNGYGTSGTRVAGMSMHDVMFVIIKQFKFSGPVRVGDPLTLIIYMRSKYGEND